MRDGRASEETRPSFDSSYAQRANQVTPYASIALATFTNPARLAPLT